MKKNMALIKRKKQYIELFDENAKCPFCNYEFTARILYKPDEDSTFKMKCKRCGMDFEQPISKKLILENFEEDEREKKAERYAQYPILPSPKIIVIVVIVTILIFIFSPLNSFVHPFIAFIISFLIPYCIALLYSFRWLNLDVKHLRKGEYEKALNHVNKKLKQQPHIGGFWNNKGLTLMHLKKLNDALFCFERALELNPELKEAKKNKEICEIMISKEGMKNKGLNG
ncbi:MAG: hypothetical protein COS08_00785 [Euryarchaeota archaeon CG01_land_8_20_14_3_00_38_12]|nr:MAG: hypothetical protein COS08_00785 [Euryarchaeota archaeon CG01_land_8_20_14_3_00_38_12]